MSYLVIGKQHEVFSYNVCTVKHKKNNHDHTQQDRLHVGTEYVQMPNVLSRCAANSN